MIEVGKMIASVRRERGLSQSQLAQKLNCSKQAISNYERGTRDPDYETLEAIADILNCPIAFFVSPEDQARSLAGIYGNYPLPANLRPISALHRQHVPLIGKVAAGQPIMAETDYDAYVDSPVQCDAALEVQGDSMAPTYLPGDILYIKCQPRVDDGRVAVVLLDDTATVKHVYRDPDGNGLTLISDNPAYAPIHVRGDDYDYVAIYGVPVGYTRLYKPDILKKIKKGM